MYREARPMQNLYINTKIDFYCSSIFYLFIIYRYFVEIVYFFMSYINHRIIYFAYIYTYILK